MEEAKDDGRWGTEGETGLSAGGVDALEEYVVRRENRSCDELGDVASANGRLCEAGVSGEDAGSGERKDVEESGVGRRNATKGIERS